jgi:molybdopterin converting factor small subunit
VTTPASVKIEVHLFATLATYLPAGAVDGTAVLRVAGPTTAGQLVRSLGIPHDLPRVVLINGRDVLVDETPLRDGDVVSVFPPLAGGAR